MTISKGEPWGSTVQRPDELRLVAGDAELAASVVRGDAVAAEAGDMFRTVGARPVGDRHELQAFPIDLVRVVLDQDREHVAIAHVLARRPRWSGGWWRGQALAVMNAEYVGAFDVAPRGHPNDGRVETFLAAAELSFRQRLAVRTRLKNATHVPHPLIATRSIRAGEWEFTAPLEVLVDGQRCGSATHLTVTVEPDAAVIHA